MAKDELARLVAAIERHTPSDGICETAVPGLIIARLPTPSAPNTLVVDPSLCIVAQGAKEVYLAGEVYRYDPAHSLLVSVDLPISARVVEASPTRPCLAVRVSLNPSVVSELLADCPDDSPPELPARGLDVSLVEPQLLDAVGRLVALLDSPQTLGPLAPLVLREITYRVLIGPQGARLREIATAGAPARQIARAIRWLLDHFAEPLPGESLARQAQIEPVRVPPALQDGDGLEPAAVPKAVAPAGSPAADADEGLDAASAAFRVGYESPSQFSREYRRMFGAPPRQDVVSHKLDAQPAS